MPKKVRLPWTSTLLFLLIPFLPLPVWCQADSGEPQPAASTNPTPSSTSPQLMEVEKLARQAVIDEVKAETSDDDDVLSEHIERLAALMITVGDQKGIQQLRPLLHDDYAHEFARQIAPRATVKDFRTRLAAAEKLTDDYRRDDEVKFIIGQELEKNLLREAAHAVTKLAFHAERFRVLDQISAAYRKTGDTVQARNFLNQAIAEASVRDPQLMVLRPEQELEDLAERHRKDDDPEGARLVLAKLLQRNATNRTELQSETKSEAAKIYARIGDYDHAHQLIDSVNDEDYLSGSRGARATLAYHEATGADPKRGLALAAELEDPELRADAFLEIAEKQSNSADAAQASETLFKALAAAREMDQFRDQAMAEIATAWANLGNISRAKQTLEEALSMDQQDSAWRDTDYIAVVFAGLGDFDRALEIATHLDPESSYAYKNIAYDQVQAGQLQQVLEWARSLKTAEAKVEVLLNVYDALSSEQ